jgi:hypothetical protein
MKIWSYSKTLKQNAEVPKWKKAEVCLQFMEKDVNVKIQNSFKYNYFL